MSQSSAGIEEVGCRFQLELRLFLMPASAPARLLLIRHGESVLGRDHRYAGHNDTPLTPKGRRQAARLRSRLKKLQFDLVFSSDLLRCRQTAALFALGRKIKTSRLLRELDFGAWDGLTAAACQRRDPERFARWMCSPRSVRPPGGESLDHLCSRVRKFAKSLAEKYRGQTLAVVTHAGPIRALVGWDVSVPPGSLLEYRWERRQPRTTL